jgi:hypothetical protein
MPSPSVFEIVKKYLTDNGYDGLCTENCGCRLDDLAPCADDFTRCVPGYEVKCDELSCCDAGWHISVMKPKPEVGDDDRGANQATGG